MGKIGNDLASTLNEIGGNSEKARINMRASQVRSRYKKALETVYGEGATQFLAHTNNVYIMNKDEVYTLIVYVDESIFAAELNAQRELIKLKLLELFNEDIEEFEIHISRGDYKKNHPYLDNKEDSKPIIFAPDIPLNDDEELYISNTVSTIDNDRLRKTIEKAMKADLAWKKGERVKSFPENRN